ncbi:MAG: hypothetical protein AB1505_36045 [Candidatus Latescibacterota bacterium]
MPQRKRIYRDWPAVLQAQHASGLSISAYCQRHGINRTLFQHRRRQAGPPTATTASAFVELRPAERHARSCGVALVSGSWRIEVEPDFDPDTLARVCACVERTLTCSR